MDFSLDLNSSRARKAKYAKAFANRWIITVYKITFVLFLVLGIAFLILSQPIGWLVLLPATLSAMMLAWVNGNLKNDRLGANQSKSISQVDQLLEFSLLANLKTSDPSAYDLWKALEQSEERYFLSNRFLIGDQYFEQLLSKQPHSAQQVWPIVNKYKTLYKLDGFPNIAVLVALVASVPNHQQILNSVKVDIKDVETAIKWMGDIHAKRKLLKIKRFSGGIGRDWAFGYTPILSSLGHNISQDIEMRGFYTDTSMHKSIVDNMNQMISSGNGTVTLVGDTGVGKTTCVHAFADFALNNPSASKEVKHHQIVALDAPTLLSRAKNPGQMEELMIRIFNEAHKAKNIILFFDDAEVFFGEGSSVDLSHIIQPALEAHSLRLILAMTPVAWQN